MSCLQTLIVEKEIPFPALVSIIHRTHHIMLNSVMKSFGLSAGQFLIMVHLSKEQGITQDSLARHFHIDKASIARHVKKLEDSGYIKRITDPENRRAFSLYLTQKGEDIVPSLIGADKKIEEAACLGLSKEETDSLYSMLLRIAKTA